jgi:uncharacterized protein
VNLSDKIIVVTGASSGFGELIARGCVRAGGRVVLAARSAGALDRLVAEFGADQALAVPTDVADPASVARLAETTLAHYGRADVLVNNAGFGVFDPVADADVTDLERMLAVNVVGAVRCTQAFLPHMRARRQGQIVMMASLAGLVVSTNMGFYSASKHALVAISRALMYELAGSGVRVALIMPGVAQTGFQEHAGRTKFSRASRLTDTTPERVAAVTLGAIARRTHGELPVPWYGWLLALASYPFPTATRLFHRLVR